MTEREKLIEVMAQAVADSFTFERAQLSPEERRTIALTAALSAIERAGYQIVRWERNDPAKTGHVWNEGHSILYGTGATHKLTGLTPPTEPA